MRNCIWCKDSDYEPAFDDEARRVLCRSHYAEYSGNSLASLDREDYAYAADMADLGY